jgi:hypothetical protein
MQASRRGALRERLGMLLALTVLACAGGGSSDGRRDLERHGGGLGDLAGLEPGWRVEPADDASLAYRHVDGSRASWLRDCRRVESSPRALARALWIAIPELEIREEAGLELAGAPAWRILGAAPQGQNPLQAEAIARVTRRCEDYFLIVEPLSARGHADAFARWWGSFRDGAGAR